MDEFEFVIMSWTLWLYAKVQGRGGGIYSVNPKKLEIKKKKKKIKKV